MLKAFFRRYNLKQLQAIDAHISALSPELDRLIAAAQRERDASIQAAEDAYDTEFVRLHQAFGVQRHLLSQERAETMRRLIK